MSNELVKDSEALVDKLLRETDPQELESIVATFNLALKKKDIIRTEKLSELQDKISAQMMERVTKRAGEFSNKDLLDYFKVVQDTITRADTTFDSIKSPSIQINQQNINIESKPMSRESRNKITSVIDSILAKAQQESESNKELQEVEVVDTWEDEDAE